MKHRAKFLEMRIIFFAVIAMSVFCRCNFSYGQVTAQPSVATSKTNFLFTVETAPDYDRLFSHDEMWSGGDVACSLPLRDGRILWLFGDSWVGPICAGRRTGTMVHNTIAIQDGLNPETAPVKFFHGNHGAKPGAFMDPADGTGYFWLTHGGIQTDGGLYLFTSRIINLPGENSVWGFRAAGMVMAKVTNPAADPSQWQVRQFKIPAASDGNTGSEKVFGMPLVREGGFIYLYGLESDKAKSNRYLLAGRVKESALEDFSAWEFYADGQWQPDFRRATPLTDHLGAELSVSYLPRFKRYVLVYTEKGFSDKIMLRSAASPIGPWSKAEVIYRTPEMGWDQTYFCYAAKAHPELSRSDDELIISYVCNSSDFSKMVADTRIYFPKFLRVKFDAIP
jgi:hypothetical protein